jgi:hypothetical protein
LRLLFINQSIQSSIIPNRDHKVSTQKLGMTFPKIEEQ